MVGGAVGLVPAWFYRGHKHMWPCGGKQHKEKKKMLRIWCFWVTVLTSCVLLLQNPKPLNAVLLQETKAAPLNLPLLLS